MKISLKIVAAVIVPLVSACSNPHLINDTAYRRTVDSCFTERKILAANRSQELFTVFRQNLSTRQTEALKFLYAFMPLSDMADYSGDFFLANATLALRSLDETPWGRNLPEDVFLHYVLPYRINNENLDSFRIVYYNEINNRIKGLSMVDAALEINHWCHEKVSYLPADIRTSAPMSTILSARGRCGEESTFTVAALRTAGIPARQVYTPRWAHTDDNHAWVEIWSDGKWYYFGACEPEAVIDRGWFTEPARRAMLIHTKSFGAPYGNENVICKHRFFSEVNNLSKYAVTKTIFVKVFDKTGNPVKNASVEYQLFNYAEFYPLAIVPTDAAGLSRFETGLGDLLVWASKDNIFNFRKISVAETDTLQLTLEKQPGTCNLTLDLDVPLALDPFPDPPKDLVEKNAARLETENSIRKKYTGSWISSKELTDWALSRKIDTLRVINIFSRTMGNYREIKLFLESVPDSLIPAALDLLDAIADKDLRDINATILLDHINNCHAGSGDKSFNDLFVSYILNPRVANEIISPWRSYFMKKLPSDLLKNGPSDPSLIENYLLQNIKIDDAQNYYKTPITPIGVNDLKVSDAYSREICFVAICRTLGIPSRLEPGSNIPQYFKDSVWHDVYFPERTRPSGSRGYIRLTSSDKKPVPEYFMHFTLARFDKGKYKTLEYDYNRKITDFKEELSLAPGSYMLVAGNRLESGKILVSLDFFDLAENEHKKIEVKLRKDPAAGRILGKIDLSSVRSLVNSLGQKNETLSSKGMVFLWIDPESEPARHFFNDLPHLKKEFDDWGGCFIFLADPASKWEGFRPDELKRMPENLISAHDREILIKTFGKEIKLPFVAVSDKNGNIVYTSSGYKIGIGEQILKYIR